MQPAGRAAGVSPPGGRGDPASTRPAHAGGSPLPLRPQPDGSSRSATVRESTVVPCCRTGGHRLRWKAEALSDSHCCKEFTRHEVCQPCLRWTPCRAGRPDAGCRHGNRLPDSTGALHGSPGWSGILGATDGDESRGDRTLLFRAVRGDGPDQQLRGGCPAESRGIPGDLLQRLRRVQDRRGRLVHAGAATRSRTGRVPGRADRQVRRRTGGGRLPVHGQDVRFQRPLRTRIRGGPAWTTATNCTTSATCTRRPSRTSRRPANATCSTSPSRTPI